jgi:hypothetical protein
MIATRTQFVRPSPKNILLAACLTVLAAAPAFPADFYVSPAGSSGGDGSKERPWNMAAVLLHPPAVKPGDTINLRGGTYQAPGRLTWAVKLKGAPGAFITIRPYPKEHAVIDGGLQVLGSWLIIRDLEVMNSNARRLTSQAGPFPTDITQPIGIDVLGPNVKVINNIIHDTSNGIGSWVSAPDNEIYGNITYYSGWEAPDRGHGHGLYLQNETGQNIVSDNIAFHQFAQGIQVYGSSATSLNNFRVEGNIVFNNGSMVDFFTRNMLIGGTAMVRNPIIRNNYSYYPTTRNHGGDVNIGYYMSGVGCTNAIFEDNYFVSGGVGLSWWKCLGTFTRNSVYGETRGFTPSSFPGNTFAPVSSRPATQKIFVRPNQYERGRAHIVVFNWPRLSGADVDISPAGLSIGDTYEIFDVQNVFGPPVTSGTYTGAVVRLPMNLTAMAAPVGHVAPPHTDSEFNVFLLRRVDNGVDTGVQPLTQTAPQVSSVTTTSATVAWSTNRGANGQVEYGTTTALGSATPVTGNGTAHTATLTGLPSGTAIYYRVRNVDAGGEVAQSAMLSFQTSAAPLTVSTPKVTGITANSAVIAWSASRAAAGQVLYGTTTALGSATPLSGASTAHAVTLSGLSAGSTIYYRVRSVDSDGQAAESSTLSFQTTSSTPPKPAPLTITTPQALNVTANSAVIAWSTSRAANAQVLYGTTNALGSATPALGNAAAHSVSLTGLPAGTTVYYRTRNADSDGQTAESPTLSFRTLSGSTPAAPPSVAATSAVVTRDPVTRVVSVAVTFTNTGGAASSVAVTMASLIGRNAMQLPALGTVSASGTVTSVIQFPATTPSAAGNLSVYTNADGVKKTAILSVKVP